MKLSSFVDDDVCQISFNFIRAYQIVAANSDGPLSVDAVHLCYIATT